MPSGTVIDKKHEGLSSDGMKVIVIRQPWAWLIVNGFKDIENRSWATGIAGPC
jgi:hypothetical protein